jgi:cysteine sulfinate desulfinase/cysteine desulfurase-like protein
LSESSLRFGLGRNTSESDIDTALAIVTQAVSRLRRVSGA